MPERMITSTRAVNSNEKALIRKAPETLSVPLMNGYQGFYGMPPPLLLLFCTFDPCQFDLHNP
jgi:hypothetical protein